MPLEQSATALARRGEALAGDARTASFRRATFWHGEQGALMVAAQLVNAVAAHGRQFYAATQTMDEAAACRGVAKYIEKLDRVAAISVP